VKTLKLTALVTAFIIIGPAAHAGTVIPYPTPGVQNSESYTFTATATGDVTGYFYGSNAADFDQVAMSVNGAPHGSFGLSNSSTAGQTFNFGSVTTGDTLSFILLNSTTGTTFSSNPDSNSDKAQHVYSINYTNPGPFALAGIPTGTFVAFEDLLATQGSDFDYNDDSFVFTNVSVANPTPIIGAFPLFASGLALVGVLALRRNQKVRSSAV
jgi:hypothetical protein